MDPELTLLMVSKLEAPLPASAKVEAFLKENGEINVNQAKKLGVKDAGHLTVIVHRLRHKRGLEITTKDRRFGLGGCEREASPILLTYQLGEYK